MKSHRKSFCIISQDKDDKTCLFYCHTPACEAAKALSAFIAGRHLLCVATYVKGTSKAAHHPAQPSI